MTDLSHAIELLRGYAGRMYSSRNRYVERRTFALQRVPWWGDEYGRFRVRVLRSYIAALRILRREQP